MGGTTETKFVKCYSYYSNFRVGEMTQKQVVDSDIENIVQQWLQVSKNKYRDNYADTTCRETLEAFMPIARDMLENIDEMRTNLTTTFKIFICEDMHGKKQAIAFAFQRDDNSLHITHLITNPDNVKCDSDTKKDGVKGAGTALVYHMITHMPSSCSTLSLTSHKNAVAFYEKCGFEKDDPENPFDYSMHFTKEKITKICHMHGKILATLSY